MRKILFSEYCRYACGKIFRKTRSRPKIIASRQILKEKKIIKKVKK